MTAQPSRPKLRGLRFGPLTRRSLHLCIDMQNLFADATPWHTPWMNAGAAGRGRNRIAVS